MLTTITVDLRMYSMSGIGRYLRNLVPLLFPQLKVSGIRVIGNRNQFLDEEWCKDPRIEIFSNTSGVYGIGGQALAWNGAFRNTELLWIPHYTVPLLYRGPLAITIHDVCHLALPESLNHPIERLYARMLFENAARNADAVFCVSEFTAKEVQRYLPISHEKIHVTQPGLDAGWDRGASAHLEHDGIPYFLYVGNVKPNKNLGVLLKAFSQSQDRMPHRLVIVGKIRGMRTIDDEVVRYAASFGDRVRLVGEVSDSNLMQYYRGATALVFPSLYEGFGLPLLEAMSLGCPVLCSQASSLPEVAGDAALYFDPKDPEALAAAMLEIQSDEVKRAGLIEKGYLRLNRFRYTDCARTTAEVLNQLILEM